MADISPRRMFVHAGILLAMLGACFAARALGFFQPGIDCSLCNGSGERVTVRWEIDTEVVERHPCVHCEGARARRAREGEVRNTLPALVLGFWGFIFVSAGIGTVWALKVVDCRVCGGAGGLALEVTSPGEGTIMVNDACFACEGRGRLTVVDRWVLLTTDRPDPTPAAQRRRRGVQSS